MTYTLGITPVDPILYQLPFERFLNPDRVTMPDIDVDFEDGRREEVIAYVGRKYGQDHVAQIITFGTMLARAAIRDVGRVLGHSYGEVDRIAKAVPNQLGIRLDEAISSSSELRGMVEGDPSVKRITDFARHLEGVARNASTHAAGVVISREPLTELMPLQKATNSDGLMSQYEMHAIEALGLLKFDFLGLSNLTILRQAVDLVRANRSIEIDLDTIPLDDATTFELLASGETTGVFQLESAGMRRYVRDLRPTSVYDLAAMVALYRPGPMDNIPAYIRRKHGQEAVTYLHPLLEPYLEKTYGIFVYQEDIMSAAIALGGFTGPEADTLGYAIRKKKSAVLRAQKEKFVSQAAERGVEPKVIDAVFKAFEPFERYGFNKAHATCYGLIAYQTAYMKANHTVDYMTAVLTAFRSNEEKVAAAVAECRRMGIEVLPPDVHSSHLEFTVEGDAIRFGLLAVKNVGQGAIESIIAARDEGGPFRSLTDFCTRIDLRLANRKVLEALAKVGALSPFGHPSQILLGLDDAVAAAQATQRDRISGQTSLFDLGAADAAAFERPLPTATEVPVRERLRWEKELLGLYLSEHPMGEVAEQVGQFVTAYSGDLRDESLDGQRVVVGGIVTGSRTVITKAKAVMAIVTMEDLQGTIEVVVFPRLYEQTAGTWREGEILLVAGRVDHKGEDVSLLADLAVDWDAAAGAGPDAFARQVAAGDRGAGRRGPGGSGDQRQRPRERVLTRRAAAGRRRTGARGDSRRCRGGGLGCDRRRRRIVRTGGPVRLPAAWRWRGARGVVRRRLAIDCAGRAGLDLPGPARRGPRPGPGRRALGSRRGPRPDRRRRQRGRAARRRSRHGAPCAVRGQRPVGPRRRGDGDLQVRHARPPRGDPSRHLCPGDRRRAGAADGAPGGRRLRRRAAGRGSPPAGRGPCGPAPGLTAVQALGVIRRICLDGRQLLVELGADRVERGIVDVQLRGDLVDDRGLLRRDGPVRSADHEAGAQYVELLLVGGERLELTGDAEVLGPTDGPRLELRHLGDEHGRRLVDRAVGLELALDRGGLLVADVEVGVGGTGQGVRGRGEQAGLLGRHRLELGDDPADRCRVAGRRRCRGRGGCCGRCRRRLGLEEAVEHGSPLPALERRMVGTDGDERAAACGRDDAIADEFGVDDDAIAVDLDRPGAQLDRSIDGRRAAHPDRVVGGDAARRTRQIALMHQVHRRRPVGVAIEQRPDDAAVQDALEGGVVGERLPRRPQLAGRADHLVALDPQALLVRRSTAEAARSRSVPALQAHRRR